MAETCSASSTEFLLIGMRGSYYKVLAFSNYILFGGRSASFITVFIARGFRENSDCQETGNKRHVNSSTKERQIPLQKDGQHFGRVSECHAISD